MENSTKYLQDKIDHNEAQLERVRIATVAAERLNLDIGFGHAADARGSLSLAADEIIEDSNECQRLINKAAKAAKV